MSVLPGEEPCQSPLPKNWTCYMSPEGRKYYVNTVSNETTWERPSSVPGTPKASLRHKNSLPAAVNGFHGSGGPLHQPEQSHVLQRKPSTDQQVGTSPVSTSSRRHEHETSVTELERLEMERIEMIRKHLCQYTTLRHETDMFNQSTVEPVDKLLQVVDPAKDRELWVKEHRTGEVRPVDMVI
uniref:Growth arrest specific 7 n=1 Tax=Electrophorus electricus TaxID=8005 RepID=A0A4W4ET26_ELEEL